MSVELKVWLDDERGPPDESWIWAHNVWDVMPLLRSASVIDLSLDYNLGKLHPTGLDLLAWMVEHHRWPRNVPTVHSRHPGAHKIMRLAISAFWRRPE